MGTPNSTSTSYLNTSGNGSGYSKGLDNDLYDARNLNFSGGDDRSSSKKGFVSKIYNVSETVDSTTSILSKAPFSLANRYALFTYNGFNGNSVQILNGDYKNTPDNPLMGGDFAKRPTAEKIVEYFSQYPQMMYEWSDLLWTKHLGIVPNNHMLTLRRYPMPVEDNIFNRFKKTMSKSESANLEKWVEGNRKEAAAAKKANRAIKETAPPAIQGDPMDDIQPDMARAVCWWGQDTDNSFEELMSFTYGYKWKTQQSETTTHEISSDHSYTSSPFYQKVAGGGVGGQVAKAFVQTSVAGVNASDEYSRTNRPGFDPYATTFPNFVIGPINVITEMQTRDQGLAFEQSIKLVFMYDMKAYGDINPRVAMLDIFANLLVLTYSNANFWGGANRFYGGSGYVAPRFGDDDLLRKGDFKGYLGSIATQIGTGFTSTFGDSSGGFSVESFLSGLSDVAGTGIGNLLGKMINKNLGAAPAAHQMKGLITGEATGNWHLTIGNPFNPIAMIGNLALESSSIKFKGPLSADDFPSYIVLEVNLKHARPRDKTDFESMFNAGKGRLYAAAAGDEDVLNLRANDELTYGAFQGQSLNSGGGENNFWKYTPGEQVANSGKPVVYANKQLKALAVLAHDETLR